MIDLGKKNVLGILINAMDYEAAVGKILHAAKQNIPLTVSATAVHSLMEGFDSAEHRHRLNHLDLVVPDGQPVRWALNLLHHCKLRDRVYGPFLTQRTCQAAAKEGLSIFLFGSTAQNLSKLSQQLQQMAPGLKIAGTQPSRFRPITPQEVEEDVACIQKSGAHIILVGLGCPRQEIWAYEMRDKINKPILAVGAAFDFFAGVKPMAPAWMQRYGLEWIFRLYSEPRRLWKRYLYYNPRYLYHLGAQYLGLRQYSTQGQPPTEPQRIG